MRELMQRFGLALRLSPRACPASPPSPPLTTHAVELDFSRPGKPTDNARVERLNGRLLQECLNAHWFLSIEDARAKIEVWRRDYNESRPHSALDWMRPAQFARRCRLQPATAIPKEPEVSPSKRYGNGYRGHK